MRPTLIRFSVLLSLAVLTAAKPSAAQSIDDNEGVRDAVRDYVEALYMVEPERIRRSVHPELTKLGFYRDQEGNYNSATMTFEELVDLSTRWNLENRQEISAKTVKEITVLDVLDRTATAKLVAKWGVDYLHLVKLDDNWKIIHVLWQSHPVSREARSLRNNAFDAFRQFSGAWRGQGPDGEPFFERYRLANDSTLEMTSFSDSTLSQATGTSRIVYKEGVILHESGRSRWLLNSIDEEGFHFVPVENARNRFTWTSPESGRWTAILVTPDRDGVDRSISYLMEQW